MIHYKFLYYRKFYIFIAVFLLLVFVLGFFYLNTKVNNSNRMSFMLYDAMIVDKPDKDKKDILENIVKANIEPYTSIAKLKLASILYAQNNKDDALKIYNRISTKVRFLNDIARLNSNIIMNKFDSVDNNLYYFSYKFLDALSKIAYEDIESAKQNLRDLQSGIDGNLYIKGLSSKVIESYNLN